MQRADGYHKPGTSAASGRSFHLPDQPGKAVRTIFFTTKVEVEQEKCIVASTLSPEFIQKISDK
jgi:hypothetical protein